jgi:hypothetical protein
MNNPRDIFVQHIKNVFPDHYKLTEWDFTLYRAIKVKWGEHTFKIKNNVYCTVEELVDEKWVKTDIAIVLSKFLRCY